MRAASYTIPPAAGDSEGGECVVYYFGSGQGGGVEANIKRWIGQFTAPDGGPADKLAKMPPHVQRLMTDPNQRKGFDFHHPNKPANMRSEAPGIAPSRWLRK